MYRSLATFFILLSTSAFATDPWTSYQDVLNSANQFSNSVDTLIPHLDGADELTPELANEWKQIRVLKDELLQLLKLKQTYQSAKPTYDDLSDALMKARHLMLKANLCSHSGAIGKAYFKVRITYRKLWRNMAGEVCEE